MNYLLLMIEPEITCIVLLTVRYVLDFRCAAPAKAPSVKTQCGTARSVRPSAARSAAPAGTKPPSNCARDASKGATQVQD